MQMSVCKARKHKQIDQGVFQFASCSKEEGQKVELNLGKRGACSVVFPNGKLGMGRRHGRRVAAFPLSCFLCCLCGRAPACERLRNLDAEGRRTGGFGLGRICLGSVGVGMARRGKVQMYMSGL